MDLLMMFKSLEAVERRRNFRLASQELLIDQSTLNKRIKRLEEYYKTKLVIRNGKDINITTAAKAILYKYSEIEKILTRVENEIMVHEDYQIATTTDIILNSTISEHINHNIHVSNDHKQIIKDFNAGFYREIILENRFSSQIEFKQKELFTTIEVGILGSKSLPDQISIKELLYDYQLIGNEYDKFAEQIACYLKEALNIEYTYKSCSCMQEVIAHVINNDNSLCIVPSLLVLPERLKLKVKSIKVTDYDLSRRIYRFKK